MALTYQEGDAAFAAWRCYRKIRKGSSCCRPVASSCIAVHDIYEFPNTTGIEHGAAVLRTNLKPSCEVVYSYLLSPR